MKGTLYGNYHSWNDFLLIPSAAPTIEAPEIRKEALEIPGADGEVDLSEYFGDVKYQNRLLSFPYSCIVKGAEAKAHFSKIQNAIHGRRLKVILDDDPDFYYIGRIKVGEWNMVNNAVAEVIIEVDADPYKYKLNPTIVSASVSGTTYIVCSNLRKAVVPEFTTTSNLTIEFDGKSTTNSAGTFYVPGWQFKQGDNVLKVTGSGIITIKYQEGGL